MDSFAMVSALYHEHKQRTGHDCLEHDERHRLRLINCDVCMHLRKLWEDEEKRHYAGMVAAERSDDDGDE